MIVNVPNMGEGVESATVLSIMVAVGDSVSPDDVVMEVETAKAVAPIPAGVSGIVQAILVKEGDKIGLGSPMIDLQLSGESPATPPPPAPAPQIVQTPTQPVGTPIPTVATGPTASVAHPIRTYQPIPGVPVAASPSLRRVADQLGIDLMRVVGSGPGGRIEWSDVRNHLLNLQAHVYDPSTPQASVETPVSDMAKWGPVTEIPLTNLRKTIADHMAHSWQTIPHVTQFDEVIIDSLLALRKKWLPKFEKKGCRPTITSFLIMAVADVLKRHPLFNSTLDLKGNQLIQKDYLNIGVAVDTDNGLMVPVIKNVQNRSIIDVTLALTELASKARDRKIGLAEMQGGSFTISNLGGIGGTHFTPIVNAPEVAILGIGRSIQRSEITKNEAKSVTVLPIAVSYDHRVIDGANGARFIADLVRTIENYDETFLK